MIPNNNLSILPFYSSTDFQNHRKDYVYGDIYPLITPDRQILPFQIIRETRVNAISSVFLRRLDGSIHSSLAASMAAGGLTINLYASEGYDIILYPGLLPLPITTPEGQYYLDIYDGVEHFYSEVFNIVRRTDCYLKIVYYDSESLIFNNGRIDYSTNFKFNLYLNTQLGKPEYPFQEEVQDRDGYTFIEKQVSEKTFKFDFLAPEYLLDAMRIIRMSDYVQITNKGELYEVDNFLITPKWEDTGNIASVVAEFQCDTVVKKIGRGITPETLGDYNDDFNNDFNN